MTMPSCIELFSGAGGAALGLRDAGFDALVRSEMDPDACATLRAAGLDVMEGDVRGLAPAGVLDLDEAPHLLWASPPCQSFSTAGKRRGANDERNGWPWTLDVVDHLVARGARPTWVVCENVTGLMQHVVGCLRVESEKNILGIEMPVASACPACYWEHEVVPAFRARFAHVSVRVLDAADYGVPQHRERVFLVAGHRPFQWPVPTHSETGLGLHRRVTVRDVLTDLPDRPLWICSPNTRSRERGAPVKTVDAPSYTVSVRGDRMFVGDEYQVRFLHLDAPDLSADPPGRRRLTLPEVAVLQGFPSDHPFQGGSAAKYRQVGNAVPPLLARALGEAIRLSG